MRIMRINTFNIRIKIISYLNFIRIIILVQVALNEATCETSKLKRKEEKFGKGSNKLSDVQADWSDDLLP